MPIYEYYCTQCGAKYEKLSPVDKADQGGRCPECGSRETHRVMSACSSSVGRSASGCQAYT